VRYVLVDRITHLVPGREIAALKNVSVSDDLVTRYRTGDSALPSAMLLEAMAQTAGILAAASTGCSRQPLLAKVQPFAAYGMAVPGDQIVLEATLDDIREEGCRSQVQATVAGRRLADATIYLALMPVDAVAERGRADVVRRTLAELFPGWFPTPEAEWAV
jgi:3-hydroxyacyl-[acyl-carrier-protein] dehydratase